MVIDLSITYTDILEGFRSMGLKGGDSLLVHSSLSSFGHVEGGAQTVIQALLDAVGPEGAVMVPTLTGKASDGKDNPPQFDVRTTPCWTGRIPETFRQMPQAMRSLHPTHSVAVIGSKGRQLIEGHEKSESPCDKRSPYYKNALLDGYVMLIGVDQECNTTVHCCEELAGVPYHLHKVITETWITGYNGEKILVRNKLHDWQKPPTDFNNFEPLFKSKGVMKTGVIGESTIRLISARAMLDVAVDTLIKDPYFLLKRKRDKISYL